MHFIVGDGHYCGRAGELERWVGLLGKMTQAGMTELSILGDFFELWIALPGLDTPWQRALLEPLRELRKNGVVLRYVIGNKDYFVDEWNRVSGLFDEVSERVVHEHLLLEHGDQVNRSDRQYLIWRRFSRSRWVLALIRRLPRRWVAQWAEKTADAMRGTNRYHKSYFPEEALRARARNGQPGTHVYGHFHVHRTLQEGSAQVVTLPFLGEENAGIATVDGTFMRFPEP